MSKIPLNVRVDPKLLQDLKNLAKRENRTLSNMVDTALKNYLKNNEKEPAK